VSLNLVLKQRKELEALLHRIRDVLIKSKTNPFISREDILRLIDRFDSTLTDMMMTMASESSQRSISLFPAFLEAENLVKGALEDLRRYVHSNNLSLARMQLDLLKTRLNHYLRIVAFMFRGGKAEVTAVTEAISGVKAPEGLSPNAFKIYAYLKQKPSLESDLITIQHALGMSETEINEAIEELRKLDYIDVLIRGRSIIIKLKEV